MLRFSAAVTQYNGWNSKREKENFMKNKREMLRLLLSMMDFRSSVQITKTTKHENINKQKKTFIRCFCSESKMLDCFAFFWFFVFHSEYFGLWIEPFIFVHRSRHHQLHTQKHRHTPDTQHTCTKQPIFYFFFCFLSKSQANQWW